VKPPALNLVFSASPNLNLGYEIVCVLFLITNLYTIVKDCFVQSHHPRNMSSQLKTLIGTIRRKPAKAPDGKRDEEVTPVMEKTTLGHDLTKLSFKDVKFVATAITTLVSLQFLTSFHILKSTKRSSAKSLKLILPSISTPKLHLKLVNAAN
jgi:hypothetical protein